MTERIDRIVAKLEVAPSRRCDAPLRVIAVLAHQLGDLAPDADDALGRRRHRTAAARLAGTAVDAAAGLHGAFGARPDLSVARSVALGEAAAHAHGAVPLPRPAIALAAAARLTLNLPHLSEEDWQLSAIAFADEPALRALREAFVVLAASAILAAAA